MNAWHPILAALVPTALAVLTVAAVAAQEPAAAQRAAPELGRLFHSAAERAALEADRGRAGKAADEPDRPQHVTIQGVLTRPGTGALAIVNGRVVGPGERVDGVTFRALTDGRVRITTADGRVHVARAGQTVDLTTGGTREAFEVPGGRADAPREAGLPVPFVSGGQERPTLEKVVKRAPTKKARRGGGKRPRPGAVPPRKPAEPAAPRALPPAVAPGMGSAAPAIPPPVPRSN
ncbi:MAG: hypothetical protein JNM90_05035 [Burkholderiales bacterium]|nr:hypothetical protein [Burkholderiales bacterium]